MKFSNFSNFPAYILINPNSQLSFLVFQELNPWGQWLPSQKEHKMGRSWGLGLDRSIMRPGPKYYKRMWLIVSICPNLSRIRPHKQTTCLRRPYYYVLPVRYLPGGTGWLSCVENRTFSPTHWIYCRWTVFRCQSPPFPALHSAWWPRQQRTASLSRLFGFQLAML